MAEYCDSFDFSENNQDRYDFIPNETDSFQFWQGLRGPYFTPSVDEDGVLRWTNNGQLPNPEPVRIVGKDGRGITLTGQCETVAELPEDPDQGEAWAVGEEEPFECYAWFGEWIDMGLLFPAGQDGVSPTVTITQTSTGHKVKITDKTHPAGQEFDVDNGTPGAPGQGVPAGGSAGQFYRKASDTDYDGEWHTLSAGDSSYDSSLTYADGTVGKELSEQKNTLNGLETEVETVENGLAIIIDGNTSSSNVSKGQYVYLKNSTITGKADGLYTYNSSTPKTAGNTFSSSELDNTPSGGLNLLNDKLKRYTITRQTDAYGNIYQITGNDVIPIACLPHSVGWVGASIFFHDNMWNAYCFDRNGAAVNQELTLIVWYVTE